MTGEVDKPAEIIAKNIDLVKQKIGQSALSSGRLISDVRLVVVSKGQPVDVIQAAIAAGIRIFGENYPEETVKKIQSLQNYKDLEWHMIGHLQSRKVRIVVENYSCLHSLDSVHLAVKLEQILTEYNVKLPVMFECNVSGEETKFGLPTWDERKWPEILPEIKKIMECKHIKIIGLMTMPPLFQDIEMTRPYFRKLFALKEFLSAQISRENFRELSMGTSADYQIAIQEGATFIRIGQAIFGPRPSRSEI